MNCARASSAFAPSSKFSIDLYSWETDAQHRFTRQELAEGLAADEQPYTEIGKTRREMPYLEPDADAWRKHRETLDAHQPFRDFEIVRPTPDGDERFCRSRECRNSTSWDIS